MSTSIVLALTMIFWSGQTAQPQTEGEKPRDGERREDRRERRRDDRGGREGRDQRRQDWERYRNATPEERQKLRTERMVEMTARNYELTDEQKVMVRAEMDRMREERKAMMGADFDRYEQLREQQFRFFQERGGGPGRGGPGGPGGGDWDRMRNNPEFEKLRNEMRQLETKYPFDWQASVKRIEALLPPEQAAKGRARFEERRSRFEGRRQQAELEVQQEMLKTMSETEQAMASGDKARVSQLLDQASKRLDSAWMSEESKQQLRQKIEAARQQAGIENPVVEEAPEHPWEKQVREFVSKYRLSAAQQSSAAGILKDVRDRASQIEIANAAKIAVAKELADAKEREEKLKTLNAPIVKLQEELTIRLNGLLTAEQRKMSGK